MLWLIAYFLPGVEAKSGFESGCEGQVRGDSGHTNSGQSICRKNSIDLYGKEVFRKRSGATKRPDGLGRVERDGIERAPREPLPMGLRLITGECDKNRLALCNCRWRDRRLRVHGPSTGSRAGRKWKYVEIAEWKVADEPAGLVEFAVRFPGEADHDVGAEGEVGAHGIQNGRDLLSVVPRAIAAVHAA